MTTAEEALQNVIMFRMGIPVTHDDALAITDLLKRCGKVVDDDWQPIETAPMDGTPLVLFARAVNATAPVPIIGAYTEGYGWIESAFTPNGPIGIVPTHWKPRPEFPASR